MHLNLTTNTTQKITGCQKSLSNNHKRTFYFWAHVTPTRNVLYIGHSHLIPFFTHLYFIFFANILQNGKIEYIISSYALKRGRKIIITYLLKASVLENLARFMMWKSEKFKLSPTVQKNCFQNFFIWYVSSWIYL